MDDLPFCKKCVLPENKPQIYFNAEGVCNLCVAFEQEKSCAAQEGFLETDFVKLLQQHKGKGRYDCLVMCSGGKDSTSALYYMKKRFKTNVLAFTFDHGFETEEALENVKNAVDILGVDFLSFKSDFMREMFSDMLKTYPQAVICHPCSMWYMQLAFDLAARFDIPVIIAGWTKGQSTRQPMMSRCGCTVHQPEFVRMAEVTRSFLTEYEKKNPKYKNFPKSMDEVLARASKRHKCKVLSPHWFLPFDVETNVETIKRELKWKYPSQSYPAKSTNCSLNYLSVYNSMKYYGYTHYHVEISKLVRQGLMTRAEALDILRIDFSKDLLNSVAKKLDFTFL